MHDEVRNKIVHGIDERVDIPGRKSFGLVFYSGHVKVHNRKKIRRISLSSVELPPSLAIELDPNFDIVESHHQPEHLQYDLLNSFEKI